MDGSTDDASVEQETMFLRFCYKGSVQHKFIAIGEPESTSSDDLYSFVIKQLKSKNIFDHMSKCVGFGSDGASNMTGVRNGLITHLKRDFPNIIGIHCLAHRLELSFKDAIKKNNTLYDKLVTLLLGLYYFYKRSPLQRKGVKKTFKVLKIKGCLPKRVGGSRWMPHMKTALESLFQSFSGYISHLQNQSHCNAKSEGLAKILASLNVLMFAFMLYEVLDPLCRLSKTLQNEEITLGEAILMVLSTNDALAQLKGQKTDRMMEVMESKQFMGYTLSSKGVISMDNTKLIDCILNAITTRFKDVLEYQLEPTVIGALRLWPAELQPDFGVSHVDKLVEGFGTVLRSSGVDVNELPGEWKHLQRLVYRKFTDPSKSSLAELNQFFSAMGVRNILMMMDMLGSLPPTSVYNETAFNQMKLQKTDRRHRLKESRLDDCMMLKLEAPTIQDFDPTEAINKWMTSSYGQRRTEYKRKKTVTKDNQNVLILDSDNEGEQENVVDQDMDSEQENVVNQDIESEQENVVNQDVESELENVVNQDIESEQENGENTENVQNNVDLALNPETDMEYVNVNVEIENTENTSNSFADKGDNDDESDMESEDDGFIFEQSFEENWSCLYKYAIEE